MKAAYPELVESAERVAKVVLAEEKQFARVLEIGVRGASIRPLPKASLMAARPSTSTKPTACPSTS